MSRFYIGSIQNGENPKEKSQCETPEGWGVFSSIKDSITDGSAFRKGTGNLTQCEGVNKENIQSKIDALWNENISKILKNHKPNATFFPTGITSQQNVYYLLNDKNELESMTNPNTIQIHGETMDKIVFNDNQFPGKPLKIDTSTYIYIGHNKHIGNLRSDVKVYLNPWTTSESNYYNEYLKRNYLLIRCGYIANSKTFKITQDVNGITALNPFLTNRYQLCGNFCGPATISDFKTSIAMEKYRGGGKSPRKKRSQRRKRRSSHK